MIHINQLSAMSADEYSDTGCMLVGLIAATAGIFWLVKALSKRRDG